MGLFDFAADMGKSIFGGDDEAPEKIKEHIEEDNPGVQNLDVQVEDGVATLTGEAESPEALEKAVLMAGNARGISAVNTDNVVAPETTEEESEFYEIKSGDTLWKIANKFYNDGTKYHMLFEANREVIKDVNQIYKGQQIRIPKA